MALYEHVVHPHIGHRKAHGPIKVADQHPTGNAAARFNTSIALVVTKLVGSMWCAYAFAVLDFISLPDALKAGTSAIISWIAQTFLQLVLLSIIMVGQNVQAEAADKRSEATFMDTEALLHGQEQVAEHLAAQDAVIRLIAEKLAIDLSPVLVAESQPPAATETPTATPAPTAAQPPTTSDGS